jgi:ribosomal protein L17
MFELELFVKHIESNLINKTVSYQQIKTTYPKIKNENLLREQIVKWNNFLKSDLHKFSLHVLSNKIEMQKEIMMLF